MPTRNGYDPRDYDYMESIVAHSGPHLQELFKPKNVGAGAAFLIHEPERLEGMIIKLRAFSWAGWSRWAREVKALARRSVEHHMQDEHAEALEAALEAARAGGKPVLTRGQPIDIAKAFRATRPNLMYIGGLWLDYVGTHYAEVEDRAMKSALQGFMDGAIDDANGEAFSPTMREHQEAHEALKNEAFKALGKVEAPCWLDGGDLEADPNMMVAAQNGLLVVSTGKLMPHTPRFFSRNALTYAYDKAAPAPVEWFKFLESVWPDAEGGASNKAALQEVFGYLLTGSTKYQKIFMLIGAPNAGKGVIAQVIEGLVGAENVVMQSVTKLGTDFGTKALLGKQVMVVPDLRLGKNTNIGGVTETLLNISGEDKISIGRKYEDDIQARLRVRLVLCANMELVLPDQSGAMRRRLHPLVFHKSFIGKEDVGLVGKLLAELPGILNWALEGLRRLEDRRDPVTGRQLGFVLTEDGQRMVNSIARRGSPVHTFLRDMCELRPGAMIAKDDLYEAFETWCEDTGEVESRHTEETFARELYTASAYNVQSTRPRIDGERVPHFAGVMLKPRWVLDGL